MIATFDPRTNTCTLVLTDKEWGYLPYATSPRTFARLDPEEERMLRHLLSTLDAAFAVPDVEVPR